MLGGILLVLFVIGYLAIVITFAVCKAILNKDKPGPQGLGNVGGLARGTVLLSSLRNLFRL